MMQGSLNLTNYSKTIYGKTILLLGLVVWFLSKLVFIEHYRLCQLILLLPANTSFGENAEIFKHWICLQLLVGLPPYSSGRGYQYSQISAYIFWHIVTILLELWHHIFRRRRIMFLTS